MRVYSYFIQKGGAGKTTSAVNHARWEAEQGKRVLLIDADPQADATFMCGLRPDDEHDLALVLGGGRNAPSLAEVALFSERDEFHVVPTFSDLENVQIGLAQNLMRGPITMRQALQKLESQNAFDVVVIDCPTGFGLLTMNAVVASDHAVVTAKPEPYHIRGIVGRPGISGGITYLLRELERYGVPQIAGVIATMAEFTNRHHAGVALLRGDRDAFNRFSASLGTGEFDEFKDMVFPELLGVVPKLNSVNARADLMNAYAPIFSRLDARVMAIEAAKENK